METYINLELFSAACQCAHLRLSSFIHVSYHSDVMFRKCFLYIAKSKCGESNLGGRYLEN